MMEKLNSHRRKYLVVIVTVLILIAVNFTIYQREQTIQHGKIILLELAPVDPRSLMQGDYMALNYQIANDAFRINNMNADTEHNKKYPQDGYIIVALTDKGVTQFKRFETAGEKLASNEMKLRYRMRDGSPKFATNAFFFEEGSAIFYEKARYGEFRVAENGEMILTKMRDQNLLEIVKIKNEEQ